MIPAIMVGMLVLVLLSAGTFAQGVRGRLRSGRRICTSWMLVLGLFGYMQAVLLYVVHQSCRREAPPIDLGRAFIAGMFLFFGLMGNVMGKVRKNFYIGIRVPWTLASDRVWNDTHRVAAWVWVAVGIIGFVMDDPRRADPPSILLLVVAALIPIVYSFVHYKSLERRGALVESSLGAARPHRPSSIQSAI